MNGSVAGYDTAAIQGMYGEYVLACDGKDRHTDGVRKKLGAYNAFTAGAFPMNPQIQDNLYERMIECAVEFEESGFIAGFGVGFRCAAGLLKGSASPAVAESASVPGCAETTTQEDARQSQEAETPPPATDDTKAETPPAVTDDGTKAESEFWKPKGTDTRNCITSRDIAKLFGVTHCSVVQRIDRIRPRLDAESKEFFRAGTYVSPKNRMYKMYLLNKAACDLYIEEINKYGQFLNIAGGLAKMRELMKEVFPVEGSAS